ncbi:MAG: serine/threonine protein kinase [Lachnospiraceae bacterium]|nr:serine/threonine protein kinase [Lachnospiraceae bacterium]
MEQQIEIITTISEHDRSMVYLAMNASGDPIVLKKLAGDDKITLFQRIQNINSSYLPIIYDIYSKEGNTYIIEEYIEGEDLSKILSTGKISEKKAFSYMEQLLEALCVLHNQNPPLIHRDIKPENILITNDDHLKVLDFDASREWREDNKISDTVLLGTRGYAAPEQFGYSQTDVRSDLYSAGIVCSQICENSTFSDKIRDRLKLFLDKATMFDPNERYQSAEEMLTELKQTEALESKNPKKRLLYVLAVLIGLIVLGTAFWYFLPSANKAYNMDILPDNYSFRQISARITALNDADSFASVSYPGLIEPGKDTYNPDSGSIEPGKDTSDTERPVLVFSKDDPQAILFYDYRLVFACSVRMDRFSDNNETVMEHLKLQNTADFIYTNGFICITTETLSRLQPGNYRLFIENKDGRWEYDLNICEKLENAGEHEICILAPVQYYSASVDNNVFFYAYNTPFKIRKIFCNGTPVSKDLFTLTKDKMGIVLPKDFFTAFADNETLKIELETNDGRIASAMVIMVP